MIVTETARRNNVLQRWIAEAYRLANQEKSGDEQDRLKEPGEKRCGNWIRGYDPEQACKKDVGKPEGSDGKPPSGKGKAVTQDVGHEIARNSVSL